MEMNRDNLFKNQAPGIIPGACGEIGSCVSVTSYQYLIWIFKLAEKSVSMVRNKLKIQGGMYDRSIDYKPERLGVDFRARGSPMMRRLGR